jgi:hypothetical protein
LVTLHQITDVLQDAAFCIGRFGLFGCFGFASLLLLLQALHFPCGIGVLSFLLGAMLGDGFPMGLGLSLHVVDREGVGSVRHGGVVRFGHGVNCARMVVALTAITSSALLQDEV